MKCVLIVGHKPSSRGAVNKSAGVTEFDFNDDLARLIKPLVEGVDIEIVYRNTYKDLPDLVNSLDPYFSISMHCNAFNERAKGSEVLYYHSSNDSRFIALTLQEAFVKALGNTDRGVKPKHSEDRGGYLLVNTDAPCVIAEPFFIDNDFELENVCRKYDDLVNAYVSAIEKVAAAYVVSE